MNNRRLLKNENFSVKFLLCYYSVKIKILNAYVLN